MRVLAFSALPLWPADPKFRYRRCGFLKEPVREGFEPYFDTIARIQTQIDALAKARGRFNAGLSDQSGTNSFLRGEFRVETQPTSHAVAQISICSGVDPSRSRYLFATVPITADFTLTASPTRAVTRAANRINPRSARLD
jgi:hypothetical protein